ncbi:MAG: hypothetical protein R3E83_02300 [Burkholderiaceae bacterium]
MQTDERHLQTTDEETPEQQMEIAIPQRLAQRGAQSDVGALARRSRTHAAAANTKGEEHDQRRGAGQHQQGLLPTDLANDCGRERHEQKLAHRPGRDTNAEGHRSLVIGNDPAKGGEDDAKRGGAQRRADQQARGDGQHDAGFGVGHAEQAGGIQQAAREQHAHRAMAVGHRAEEGCRQPPEQILDGEREREQFT